MWNPLKTVTVEFQIYPVGIGFHHSPSNSQLLLSQDAMDPKVYYLTTIKNAATPSQNCTTLKIIGSRNDGLLEHEICPFINAYEFSFVDWSFECYNTSPCVGKQIGV
ncbi:hypothetical protein C4588_04730 [Candidatus Parcubacteria bacterium]|nr:MAG: hypothetical protein C4588_04730 [Candidatus Parcubacteria bacterium]